MNYINYKEIWACIVLSFPFLYLGVTSGFSTQYIFELNSKYEIPADEESWIGSSGLMLSFVGCFINGYIMDKFGRRSLLFATFITHAVGWMVIAKTQYLITGRILVSFGNGIAIAGLMYAAELMRPQYRAALSISASAAEIFGSIGIYFLGYYIPSLTLAFILSLLAVILLILSFTVPESPYWFMVKKRKDEAIKALVWIRDGDELGLDSEIEDMEKNLDESSQSLTFAQIVFNVKWWKTLALFTIYIALIELTGFDMIIPYSVQYFSTINRTGLEDKTVALIFVGAAFFGTIGSMFAADRMERKPLMQILNLYNFVLLTIAATSETFFYGSIFSSIITIVCFIMYSVTVATTAFTLPWTTISELLPTESRATLFATLSAEFSIFYFLIVLAFPTVMKTISPNLIIWAFAVFSLLNYIFVFLFIKETKGIILPGSRNA